MSSGVPTNSPRRSCTYAIADLNDVDGIKVSIATVAAAVQYAAADFDGAAVVNSGAGWAKFPRTVTITRAANGGSYTTTDITITGKRNGKTITETLTPADADGGDVLRGSQAWDAPPTIDIPAQVNTSGAFEIGVGDICSPSVSERFTMVVFRGVAGQMNLQFGEDPTAAQTDSFPLPADAYEVIAFSRVLTDPLLTVPTVQALTVYQA
jgi:hypothetical protein